MTAWKCGRAWTDAVVGFGSNLVVVRGLRGVTSPRRLGLCPSDTVTYDSTLSRLARLSQCGIFTLPSFFRPSVPVWQHACVMSLMCSCVDKSDLHKKRQTQKKL